MLRQTALDLAPGEIQIAAQEMPPCELDREVEPGGQRLGLLQVGERAIQIVGHPLHCCEAEQCPAAVGVVRCDGERRLVRAQRLGHGADMLEQLAPKAG